MSIDDLRAHFPKMVDQELTDYVNNVALLSSRYLFVSRVQGIQFAYCTHCQRQYTPCYLIGTLKHNEERECEKCGSRCIVKASGRGRSRLIDEAYILWYGKSEVRPDALIARGIYVKRDYTGDFKNVRTQFYVQAEYLFEPGNPRGQGKERFGKAHMVRQQTYYNHFYRPSSIMSELEHAMQRPPFYLDKRNVQAAVQGTIFQYSGWEKFLTYREESEWIQHGFNVRERRVGEPRTDLVKFFELAAMYPCTEYLIKMGLASVVEAKINGWNTYRAVNWRGTTIEKVLRLSKPEIKALRVSDIKITPLVLHSYHFHKKKGLNLSFEEAYKVRDLTFDHVQDLLKGLDISHSIPMTMTMRYVIKQYLRPGADKIYSDAASVVRDYRDYLSDCRKLGMDMESDAVLYPNDLHRAHQKTTEKVKYKEDKTLNVKIAKRLADLKSRYEFERDGLFIRPAVDSIELFREGQALRHCVGGYAKQYAEGKSDLLLVRRSAEPDKPFYTMEVQKDKVVQCRGLKNYSMTPEVKAFVEAFITEKLEKKKARVKVAARQEVAI